MTDKLTHEENYDCKDELQIILEQSEKLCENNNNRNLQKHIRNRTEVHDLTYRKLQDEDVAEAKQLPSSIAVRNCHYANDQVIDIMSVEIGERTVDELSTCVDSDETLLYRTEQGENITHIDVPDQPSPKSDLVTTNGKFDQVKVNSESGDESKCHKNTDKKGVINRAERETNDVNTNIDNNKSSDIDKDHDYMMVDVPIDEQLNEVAYPDVEEGTFVVPFDDTNGNDINCCDSCCYYCGVI